MEVEVVGTASFGTGVSFVLRLGQTLFSSASLLFMCFDDEFYAYTAFCYLVTIMGLVTPWSVTLALVDAYSVIVQRLPLQARVISVIMAGDFVRANPITLRLLAFKVLSFLSLGGVCASSSVVGLMKGAGTSFCGETLCSRYQLSATMAFLSCLLSLCSTFCNLWLIPGLLSH
ncbi:PREDICTED: CASP-like protein 5C1 isoform X1 [Tarenaya hassleriana]|uniref:CASP-like protein 5C1 isoform X1 n=1 Tax=Tarenaya hassleriana TaxID=28532 RepID=UPI00053C2895|nr:PREDICTED: CASP-like protein 5C1 isoform X1 [Tarenaya hassleriana]